jgi:nonribosomal peptide synthetase DhbF
LAQQLDLTSPNLNLASFWSIDGPLNVELFQRSVRHTVNEAESLHTHVVGDNEEPMQITDVSIEWLFPIIDLSRGADPRLAAKTWMSADAATPKNMRKAPLFSVALLKTAPDQFFWYQGCHHLVADGFSMSLIASRVAEVYAALTSDSLVKESRWGSYDLLLAADSDYRASPVFGVDRNYWLRRFADRPGRVSLSTARQSGPPGRPVLEQTGDLGLFVMEGLRSSARQARTGWSAAMIAMTAAYQHRMTGSTDVVLGFPVTGRRGLIARETPGMTANELPLRLTVHPHMTCTELIRETADETRAVLRHQRYRGEDLRRDLNLFSGEHGGCGTRINIHPLEVDFQLADCKAEVSVLSSGPVEDLSIFVRFRADGALRIIFHANPDLCTLAELADHHRRFLAFLGSFISADQDKPLGEIEILQSAERLQVLTTFNDTTQPQPVTTLTDLFRAQVARTPNADALIFKDDVLTYAQLDTHANQLAHQLITHGADPEAVIALAMPRSIELITAMLAVTKTGAAYLALDLDYPAERIAFMLSDTQPILLVTQNHTLPSSSVARALPLLSSFLRC